VHTDLQPGNDDPEQWLDEHGEALFAFALARVNEPSAAEDLVQETLLAGFEALDKFQGGATTRTWLISILKNKLVDRIRKLRREAPLDPDVIDNAEWQAKFDDTGHWVVAPSAWRDPSSVLENEALGSAMMRCIAQLPEQLRTLIMLRDIDGYESQELIEILNISSANNLWVMLSRGREKLRVCMDKTWFAET
jgi:RNA polymerase sigma-70 factor (ECF subfamily)